MSETISINFKHPQPVEFELTVDGSDSKLDVRFILTTKDKGYNISIPCTKAGDKWVAKIPTIDVAAPTSYQIEVVVDGYLFVPATGKVKVMTEPSVAIPKTTQKISEAASQPRTRAAKQSVKQPAPIVVQQEEEQEATEEEEGHVTYDPVEMSMATESAPYVPPTFNPRQVAEQLIKNTMGGIPVSAGTGTLFQRDTNGRIITPGVEHPGVQQDRVKRSERVRQILSGV